MPVHDDGVGPLGTFPHGKISDEDEGALQIAIKVDSAKQVAMIHFGVPVRWIALDRDTCIRMAHNLLTAAAVLA